LFCRTCLLHLPALVPEAFCLILAAWHREIGFVPRGCSVPVYTVPRSVLPDACRLPIGFALHGELLCSPWFRMSLSRTCVSQVMAGPGAAGSRDRRPIGRRELHPHCCVNKVHIPQFSVKENPGKRGDIPPSRIAGDKPLRSMDLHGIVNPFCRLLPFRSTLSWRTNRGDFMWDERFVRRTCEKSCNLFYRSRARPNLQSAAVTSPGCPAACRIPSCHRIFFLPLPHGHGIILARETCSWWSSDRAGWSSVWAGQML
jgi:hypothetical protein